MRTWGTEFKQFLLRGNVVDLAVGIVIGAAFAALVQAAVTDLLTPLVAAIFEAFGTDADTQAASEVLVPALLPLYATLDPDNTGGAMLLGVDGLCLISHGSSSATAVVSAVRVAKELHDVGIVERLRAAVTTA